MAPGDLLRDEAASVNRVGCAKTSGHWSGLAGPASSKRFLYFARELCPDFPRQLYRSVRKAGLNPSPWKSETRPVNVYLSRQSSSFPEAPSAASSETSPMWAPSWTCQAHLAFRTSSRWSFRVRSPSFPVERCGARSDGSGLRFPGDHAGARAAMAVEHID